MLNVKREWYIFSLYFWVFLYKVFWSDVVQEINNILRISLDLDPLVCILGILPHNTWNSSKIQLLKILLFTARCCILLQWISEMSPTKTQWTKSILDIMPLEALSSFLKNKPLQFYKIWDPFLSHLGDSLCRTLKGGLCGIIGMRMSWTQILLGASNCLLICDSMIALLWPLWRQLLFMYVFFFILFFSLFFKNK